MTLTVVMDTDLPSPTSKPGHTERQREKKTETER